MSRHVKSETTESRYEYGYCCDSCQAEIEDTQETLHWRMTGGYSSIYTDRGAVMDLYLCPKCDMTHISPSEQCPHCGFVPPASIPTEEP